jgi:opacity protein-like surface antigen
VKRSIVIGSGVAVLFASAVGAQATPNVDSGKYKGKTNKHNPVTFRVTHKKQLTHFTHYRLKMRCSDDESFRVKKRPLDSGPKRLFIDDAGRFAFTVTYTDGGRWIVRGRIKGRRAKGTLRMIVRFNSDNRPAKHGKIRCTSGKLHWTAKHRRS